MSIRIKNIDYSRATGLKPRTSVILGDVTATREYMIFVAPVACRVETLDLFSGQGVSGASGGVGGNQVVNFRVEYAAASDTTVVASISTSSTGASPTREVSANALFRMSATANQDLSAGRALNLYIGVSGTGNLSGAHVLITYTPIKHGETV